MLLNVFQSRCIIKTIWMKEFFDKIIFHQLIDASTNLIYLLITISSYFENCKSPSLTFEDYFQFSYFFSFNHTSSYYVYALSVICAHAYELWSVELHIFYVLIEQGMNLSIYLSCFTLHGVQKCLFQQTTTISIRLESWSKLKSTNRKM